MSTPKETFDQVKCGACNKYLSFFPIYIAKDKVPLCGRCTELLNDESKYIRDTPYESLAQNLKFPCIYNVEGCLENLFPAQVPKHEKICPFRVIPCPLDCMWQGSVNDLQQHFEELHPQALLRNGEFEIDFLNAYEIYSLVIFSDELFCFKRKFEEDILECSLMCYKVIDPVTKYKYEISVQNGARSLEVKFPLKSAEDFQQENVTEIGVEHVKNKLNDPSIIIGKIRILTEQQETKPAEVAPKKVHNDINYEMLRELECPVCFDYIIPPIYQCVTGHSICGDCKGQVRECPTCKMEIKNTQNFTLEKMAYYLTYPCRFAEYGCDFVSKPGKIKLHQKHCLHGPHKCPLREYEECNWESAAKEIFPHVLSKHHENVLEIDSVSLFIDSNYFKTEDEGCYILKFSDALFKLHYLYERENFYWAMQLIGPPEEANKYKFEIDIVDNTNNNQRLFVRSFCAPLNHKDHSFETIATYVTMNVELLKPFITDIFTYRIRIVV